MLASIHSAFAAMCDTPSSDCELLSDRTFTAPNTYDYTPWNAIDVVATSGTPTVTLTQTGGTVLGKVLVLETGAYYNMSGGVANISGDYIVSLWSQGAVTSGATQTGGTMNVGGNLRFSLYNGNRGSYTLNGGNLNVSGQVNLVGDATNSAYAYLYLNGGVLTTNHIARDGNGIYGNQDYQTRAELHFNGGTLRAKDADNANWIRFSSGYPYLNNISVLAIDGGGATFDTNGRNMGIAVNLPGSGGLTKSGVGTLTLSGSNSYAGRTSISAGTLEVSASSNLGAGSNAFGLYGGTLRVTGTGFTGLDSRNVDPANFGGAIDIADAGNTFSVPQSVGNGNNTTLTKLGAGTLVLGGQDSWTGGTTVNAGTLRLAGTPTSGIGTIRKALVINNATVELTAQNALGYSSGLKVDSIAINGGTLINSAAGTNGDNGWGVAYALNGATMRSNSGIADPAASSNFSFGGPSGNNTQVNVSGTTASMISGHVNLRGDNGNGNVNFTVNTGATLNVAASFSSHLGIAAGAAGFSKLGGGLMSLQAANTHSGDTVVSAGTLAINNASALAASTLVLNAGALSFPTITNATFGGLTGPQSLALQTPGNAAVALSVGANNVDTSYAGVLTGGGSLSKIGSGSLTLTGSNTFSGTTSVSAGTLRIAGVTGSGAVTVSSGATLAGTGTSAGATIVQNGGHVAPGSSVGKLTFSNGLSLNGGAVFDLDIGTSSDLVRVSGGSFSATSGIVLNLAESAGFGVGNYTLIDFTGATPSGIVAANFTLGTVSSIYGYSLSVQGTKLMLAVTLTPPTVTGASVPANGAYNLGKPLDFTVHFDKAVTVTGVPRLPLILNSGTVFANFVSGSATADLLFRATVAAGNSDNDGIALAIALDANGGTLRNAIGTDAELSLNNVPSTAGVTVDGVAPTATSIHLVGSPPHTSYFLSYTVTFSEAVTGIDGADFSVKTIDGTAGAEVNAVSGSGANYTVTLKGVGGVGHLVLTLTNGGTGIVDLAGNPIAGGFGSGDVFEANLRRRCVVAKQAVGANDGADWADAYTDLQTALHDAGCVEFWVAKGIYKPGSATTDSFRVRENMKFYGGFAGTESTLEERTAEVIAANPSVLSGDIDNNDSTDADGVVLDAVQIAGSNSVNVINMNNAPIISYDNDTVIDGFIVTAGDASVSGLGGGLRCDASLSTPACNVILGNLVFSGNRATAGGALSFASSAGSSNPVLSKIVFRGNRATNSGGAVYISASTAGASVSPAFSNVIFSGNASPNWGGAIDLNVNLGSVTPTFDNVTFSGNTSAAHRGSAMASQAFGGGTALPTLRNTILWDGSDPEIVLDGSGAAVLDHVVAQGGCPTGSACTNLIAGNPQLDALGNHGGAIPSVLLGGGSVAVDSGTCVLADDIRGIARAQGAGCDIGAVEIRLSALSVMVYGDGNVSAGPTPLPTSGSIAACVDSCSATYDGETQPTVTLTATPNATQSFSAWSGDCSGTNPVASVAMTMARTCIATFVPNLATTTLMLSGGSNPSTYGNVLSFTARVTSQIPGAPLPTGNVEFHDGATLLTTTTLDGDGNALFSIFTLNAGAHAITARYGGDANYAAGVQPTSAILDQAVIAATPELSWNAPGAIVYGTPLNGAQLNALASANGIPVAGSLVYSPPAGTVLGSGAGQPLSVVFTSSDANFSAASLSVTIDVTRAALGVTGTVVQDKLYDGTTQATLTGGALVGVLAADAGDVTLSQAGEFAQADVGVGIAVTANDAISGSAAVNYLLTQPGSLNGRIAPATLTYLATPLTIPYGTTPSGLGGSVSGFIPGESQANATTGTLSFTTTATAASAPGLYAINGDGLSANHGNYVFTQDPANVTALTITAAATTTTITNAQPWNAPLGTPVTVIIAVAPASPGSAMPTGSVTVSDGATGSGDQCTIALLTNGAGSCTLTPATAGAKTVTASYTPDAASSANFIASFATSALTIDPTQPASSLQSSANPSVFGQAVTLTATVTAISGGVTPAGAVHFFIDDTTEICANTSLGTSGTPTSASAECAVPQAGLSVGEHVMRFEYDGDSNNTLSSATLNQIVDKADQILTFPAQSPPSHPFRAEKTFMIDPLATSAAPNSGQVIVYSSLTTGVCSVNGITVTMLATGTCTLAADQTSNADYNAAAQVTQSVALLLAPTATSQSVTLAFNTAKSITLSGNDANPGGPYTLTYAIATPPAHGSISGFNASTGSLTYTPTNGYSGLDSFTFSVGSANGTSQPATVSVSVSTPIVQLALGVSDWNAYVGYGQIVDATIQLSNNGDAVQSHTVTFALSAGFDAAHAVISCADAGNGATCTQSPTSPLQFEISLPVARSLTWNIAVPVLVATTEPNVTLGATTNGGTPVSAMATLVLFRDGFDDMQVSAVTTIGGAQAKAILDGDALQGLVVPATVAGTTTLLLASDGSREARVESRFDGKAIQVRLRTRDVDGQQHTSSWSGVEAGATLVLGSADMQTPDGVPERAILLDGATTTLVVFPASATPPQR